MPIDLPDLDDRRYADLMDEALRMIPAHAPAWTNHNPSDPGITLIELFAYVTEMLLYRLNRVAPDNFLAFLNLINGPDWKPFTTLTTREWNDLKPWERDSKIAEWWQRSSVEERGINGPDWKPFTTLTTREWNDLKPWERDSKIAEWWQRSPVEERGRMVAETVRQLRKPMRAISPTDFEALARAADARVARVHCIPRNTDGHIRMIVVPDPEKTGGFGLPADLEDKIRSDLQDRCLLTTQLDVEGPKLAKVSATLTLVLESDTPKDDACKRADSAFRRFVDPLTWPFGQAIYISKLTALFADLAGIRDVLDIKLSVTPAALAVEDRQTGDFSIAADVLAIAEGPMTIKIPPGT